MTDQYYYFNGTRLAPKTPNTTSAGAADAGKIVALNSSGQIDASMMPTGTGQQAVTVTASENISAGALINFWLNGATLNMRNADNTSTGKAADGFVTSAVTNGSSGTAFVAGLNTALSGLTIGATYYLGTVGTITTTPPAAASGSIVQAVGKATAANTLVFNPASDWFIA